MTEGTGQPPTSPICSDQTERLLRLQPILKRLDRLMSLITLPLENDPWLENPDSDQNRGSPQPWINLVLKHLPVLGDSDLVDAMVRLGNESVPLPPASVFVTLHDRLGMNSNEREIAEKNLTSAFSDLQASDDGSWRSSLCFLANFGFQTEIPASFRIRMATELLCSNLILRFRELRKKAKGKGREDQSDTVKKRKLNPSAPSRSAAEMLEDSTHNSLRYIGINTALDWSLLEPSPRPPQTSDEADPRSRYFDPNAAQWPLLLELLQQQPESSSSYRTGGAFAQQPSGQASDLSADTSRPLTSARKLQPLAREIPPQTPVSLKVQSRGHLGGSTEDNHVQPQSQQDPQGPGWVRNTASGLEGSRLKKSVAWAPLESYSASTAARSQGLVAIPTESELRSAATPNGENQRLLLSSLPPAHVSTTAGDSFVAGRAYGFYPPSSAGNGFWSSNLDFGNSSHDSVSHATLGQPILTNSVSPSRFTPSNHVTPNTFPMSSDPGRGNTLLPPLLVHGSDVQGSTRGNHVASVPQAANAQPAAGYHHGWNSFEPIEHSNSTQVPLLQNLSATTRVVLPIQDVGVGPVRPAHHDAREGKGIEQRRDGWTAPSEVEQLETAQPSLVARSKQRRWKTQPVAGVTQQASVSRKTPQSCPQLPLPPLPAYATRAVKSKALVTPREAEESTLKDAPQSSGKRDPPSQGIPPAKRASEPAIGSEAQAGPPRSQGDNLDRILGGLNLGPPLEEALCSIEWTRIPAGRSRTQCVSDMLEHAAGYAEDQLDVYRLCLVRLYRRIDGLQTGASPNKQPFGIPLEDHIAWLADGYRRLQKYMPALTRHDENRRRRSEAERLEESIRADEKTFTFEEITMGRHLPSHIHLIHDFWNSMVSAEEEEMARARGLPWLTCRIMVPGRGLPDEHMEFVEVFRELAQSDITYRDDTWVALMRNMWRRRGLRDLHVAQGTVKPQERTPSGIVCDPPHSPPAPKSPEVRRIMSDTRITSSELAPTDYISQPQLENRPQPPNQYVEDQSQSQAPRTSRAPQMPLPAMGNPATTSPLHTPRASQMSLPAMSKPATTSPFRPPLPATRSQMVCPRSGQMMPSTVPWMPHVAPEVLPTAKGWSQTPLPMQYPETQSQNPPSQNVFYTGFKATSDDLGQPASINPALLMKPKTSFGPWDGAYTEPANFTFLPTAPLAASNYDAAFFSADGSGTSAPIDTALPQDMDWSWQTSEYEDPGPSHKADDDFPLANYSGHWWP